MASEMMEALMELCREKHLDELELIDQLEQSLAKSYADSLNLFDGARVTISRETGKVYVYKKVPIEESFDDETGLYTEFDEVDITPKDSSRLAAMHAKNVINEMVRNASRQHIYEEFSERIGELLTGTVIQTTDQFAFIKIREGVEAELPYFNTKDNPNERNERPEGERYGYSQRIRAVIVDVRNPNSTTQVRGEAKRPAIIVSRASKELIRRLFELEVPEVYDGVVKIHSIAREAGIRSKVAVSSVDPNLDPVGACVGPKGSRVRSVVTELRGERVDVVLWDEDPRKCVANALSPARVSRVLLNDEGTHATVIVPDDQLSLAIGKEGQNARLAARLTGLHIDIKNESLAQEILNQLPQDIDEELEEGTRCAYVGPTGIQCRNMARPGSEFCGVHENMDAFEDFADFEVSDDPDSLI